MSNLTSESFFSVSFNLILTDRPLPYKLYINSSSHEKREKFVCIWKEGRALTGNDLASFKKKYFQLYVLETERAAYLKSLMAIQEGVGQVEKGEIIKDSAIGYLQDIFETKKGAVTNDVLEKSIDGCRDSVDAMVDLIQESDVNEVQKLIGDLSFHDFYTYDHSINVSMYCITILKTLKPDAKRNELVMAGMGGLLHDLGKIKIPTRIINNPGRLAPEDFEVIKKHPDYGSELLLGCNSSEKHTDINFEIINRVIHEHHENYNGTGYPRNLKGQDIHVYARITAIADFYDAITTKRSYHEVLTTEDALSVMARSVGRKIDPKIFQVFTENVHTILKGKSHIELPDDFDPCQPHEIVPIEKPKAQTIEKDFFSRSEEEHGIAKSSSGFSKKKNAS